MAGTERQPKASLLRCFWPQEAVLGAVAGWVEDLGQALSVEDAFFLFWDTCAGLKDTVHLCSLGLILLLQGTNQENLHRHHGSIT